VLATKLRVKKTTAVSASRSLKPSPMRSVSCLKGELDLHVLIDFRLTFEFESLQKVEGEQKTTIEKLSNNES
jgi:hypothetical protein